mmetsp:Transcript_11117/g.15428  ORF Transcript_11117/g.15428 Transcript_11117/m.15428 type:complete len:150 (-) Transcript_11117:138-587(-)
MLDLLGTLLSTVNKFNLIVLAVALIISSYNLQDVTIKYGELYVNLEPKLAVNYKIATECVRVFFTRNQEKSCVNGRNKDEPISWGLSLIDASNQHHTRISVSHYWDADGKQHCFKKRCWADSTCNGVALNFCKYRLVRLEPLHETDVIK